MTLATFKKLAGGLDFKFLNGVFFFEDSRVQYI